MPLIGLATGGVNLSGLFLALDFKDYPSADAAKAAGAGILQYGAFLQAVVNFIIIALSIFVIVKLTVKLLPQKEAAAHPVRKCPFCLNDINEAATRCPHCTGKVKTKIVKES